MVVWRNADTFCVRVQAVKDKWAGLRVKACDNVNLARWRALQECVGNRIAQVTAAKRRELLACWTAYMGMACTEQEYNIYVYA
jgi:kynureninase